MATDSGQRFIRRNRPPRVHITYEDPYNAERRIELPFVMGVLSDLSGNNSSVEKPDVAERKFLEFDMDNFENRMAAIEPGAAFNVANKLGDGAARSSRSIMHFRKMDDFSPAAVARQVPALAQAAAGARSARQPAALHGRQGRRRRPDQGAAEGPAADGRVEQARACGRGAGGSSIRRQALTHGVTNGHESKHGRAGTPDVETRDPDEFATRSQAELQAAQRSRREARSRMR